MRSDAGACDSPRRGPRRLPVPRRRGSGRRLGRCRGFGGPFGAETNSTRQVGKQYLELSPSLRVELELLDEYSLKFLPDGFRQNQLQATVDGFLDDPARWGAMIAETSTLGSWPLPALRPSRLRPAAPRPGTAPLPTGDLPLLDVSYVSTPVPSIN